MREKLTMWALLLFIAIIMVAIRVGKNEINGTSILDVVWSYCLASEVM